MKRIVTRIGHRWIGLLVCVFLNLVLAMNVGATVTASGGNATNDFGPYRVHVFTEVGDHQSFTVTGDGGRVDVLIIGGGGSGGRGGTSSGGGGGAGGLIYNLGHEVTADTYTVDVGDGGSGQESTNPGEDGENSSVFGFTAFGGGGGGSHNTAAGSGGSGGGQGAHSPNTSAIGQGTPGQGHNGGASFDGSGVNAAGGGGGASDAGGAGVELQGGAGGSGRELAFTNATPVWYAGGGGGGTQGSGGAGGVGGGGTGSGVDETAEPGLANTGGGGGGSAVSGSSGAGGSGLVAIRYVVADRPLSVMANEASGIGGTNATLNGRVGGTDGEPNPDVYFCWGPSDGGNTSTGDWHRVVALGTRAAGEYISHELFELEIASTYAYRVYATNSTGQTAWSEVREFSTITPLTAWMYRLPLTFEEPVGVPLTNFPALVKLSEDIPGFVYSQFADTETAADLRFSDAELETELPYEIEHWDTGGTTYIWVRIPELAGTNETIYALWGLPGAEAPDYRDDGSVWTADYRGVWHLNEGQAGQSGNAVYRDSTIGGHHGIDRVTDASTNGIVHRGQRLQSEYEDHIEVPSHLDFSFGDGDEDQPFSFSAWVYFDGSTIRPVNKAETTGMLEYQFIIAGDGSLRLALRHNSSTANTIVARTDPGLIPLNQWSHVAVTYNGIIVEGGQASVDGITFYLNSVPYFGTNNDLSNNYKAMRPTDSIVSFGSSLHNWSGGQWSEGGLDEVRIMAGERSAEWIWADYMTVASNDVFMTYGVVQATAADLGVLSSPPDPVRDTDATARGVVLETGSKDNADVYVCWDTSDNLAVSTGDWSNVVFVGNYESYQSLSAVLSPLSPSSSYAYRFFATNSAGESAWSGVQAFDTVDVPAVSASPMTAIGRQVATLHGEVTDDGGETPLAGFEWWQVGGAVTTVVSKSFQDGAFSETLEGLTESTEYAYRAWASNAAGQVWSGEHAWTTLSANPLAFYVTPDGAGDRNGSDWENAFGQGDLHTVLAMATVADDEIRIRYGVYTNSAQLSVTDHPGLTLRGGYEGSGSPGGFSSDPTILTRDPTVRMRIFYGKDSVLTLDRLTFAGGFADASDGPQNGIGLAFDNCTTIMSNSVIRNNESTGLSNYGGGVAAHNGSLTIVDSFIDDNQIRGAGGTHGGGLYANNVNLTLIRTHITRNRIGGNTGHYGGGIHLNGGNALIDDCMFGTNYVAVLPGSGWTYNNRAGAIYADNVSPLTIANTRFYGNYVAGNATSGNNFGGALDIRGSSALTIGDCVFTGNRLVAGATRKGGVMHLSGVAGTVANTFVAGAGTTEGAPELLYVSTTGANHLTISNTVVQGMLGAGIRKAGTGSATLYNCLVFNANDHGFAVSAGTANVRQTTLTGNAGWGIYHDGGTLTVSDTICWDNTDGGISTSGGAINYTLSQESHGGSGNLTDNPLFIAGYYLSHEGLPGQLEDSPAVGAGSMTAGTAGLTDRTTRTDGANPDTGDTVDMGYHYAEGYDGDLGKVLNIFVDVVEGNDEDEGTEEEPLKTITEALSRAISGSTIHIATGVYNTVSGEVFPLETQHAGLTMIGQGPGLTVLDAEETDRVFRATGGAPFGWKV